MESNPAPASSGFRIRESSPEDADFALQATGKENWGYSIQDFVLLFSKRIGTHFIAEEANTMKPVGMLSIYIYEGKVAWIGNVVTLEEFRRRGIATALVGHAERYLRRKRIGTIRLYSYAHSESLYLSLGYSREGPVRVFSRPPVRSTAKNRLDMVSSDLGTTQIGETHWRILFEFDRKCFGVDRRNVLRPMLQDEGTICLAKFGDENKRVPVGYILALSHGDECEVGPWICSPSEIGTAKALVSEITERFSGMKISVAAPLENRSCVAILGKLGFSAEKDVMRMRKGRDQCKGRPSWIMAVGGLEKG